MNIRFEINKLENKDVIATSGNAVVGTCSWETIKTNFGITGFNTNNQDIDDGKSFLYSGEESWQIGPLHWAVYANDMFYDDKGNLLGTAPAKHDTSYFVNGKHYHAGFNSSGDIWVECSNPSHYRD